jgi:hypothetical protein
MSQEKLNLFQLTAGVMAQSSASSPLIPHAALAPLCRLPDYAESLDLSCAGKPLVARYAA